MVWSAASAPGRKSCRTFTSCSKKWSARPAKRGTVCTCASVFRQVKSCAGRHRPDFFQCEPQANDKDDRGDFQPSDYYLKLSSCTDAEVVDGRACRFQGFHRRRCVAAHHHHVDVHRCGDVRMAQESAGSPCPIRPAGGDWLQAPAEKRASRAIP